MAAVDPYAPCPCGSGEKFKWCCHKVESFADRAQKLVENGQNERAIEVLEEGLRKVPGNAWLLLRKAVAQLRLQQFEPAKETLRAVLRSQPRHLGALHLLTQLVLETEEPSAGVAQFQQALTALPVEKRASLATLARTVGAALGEAGDAAAAIAQMRLAIQLDPDDPSSAQGLRTLLTSAKIPAFQKNPYRLSPLPEALAGPARESFRQALEWAEAGLWSSAASAFELLGDAEPGGREADRNAGLCRLWMDDEPGAIAALRRYVRRAGPTDDAVELEALCQQIEPPAPEGHVERVRLTWPLRDRSALIEAIKADPSLVDNGESPLDPEDPDSPDAESFSLLDRPAITNRPELRPEDIARVLGEVLVGDDSVVLETIDDGRLDGLIERLTTLAGPSVPPAHPRTRVVEKVPRNSLHLSWQWALPEGVDSVVARRLTLEESARIIRDEWPNLPLPYLGGRTPLEAARAGDAVIPLRAALLIFETGDEGWQTLLDFAPLRSRLNLEPEPAIDPETVDIAALHIARLSFVPVERLNDERLALLYRRAREFGRMIVLERAARELVNRPESWAAQHISSKAVYTDLATLAAALGQYDEAFTWIRRGRQADSAAERAANAPHWDLTELRHKARSQPPETWVPELAVILERYENSPDAGEQVLMTLVNLGLVVLAPHPERPGEVLLDSRRLEAVLQRYGPRVTTASGRLGVSATRGAIWTPGAESGGGGASGGVWTPGAAAQPTPAADKPRIIVPGR